MIAPSLLKILVCPETHQSLRLAEPALLDTLNQRIKEGLLRNRAGQVVTLPLEGALVREDAKFFYPIRNNIPVMLIDEAIPLTP
ncbi:MAG TPA: Trm112 family protein [Verrucomicrobiae bacterium]|nr:Trm112 family protein [Verrucomicrobiae bacterium]